MGSQEQVPYHRDPGLQPERVYLSWMRTCLSLFILVLAQVRFGQASWILSALLLAAMGWIFLTSAQRYRAQSRGIAVEHYPPNSSAVFFLAGMVLLSALTMVLALVFS